MQTGNKNAKAIYCSFKANKFVSENSQTNSDDSKKKKYLKLESKYESNNNWYPLNQSIVRAPNPN